MNILTLIPDCLDRPMGGMGEQYRNLLHNFSDNLDVTVVGSNFQPNTEYSLNKRFCSISSSVIPLGDINPHFKTFLTQSDLVKTGLKCKKPDVIHALDWSTFYAGVSLSQEFNVPLITTIQLSIRLLHEDMGESMDNEEGNLLQGLELMGVLNSSKIIHVSECYKNRFPSLLSNKSVVIPNGINLKEWDQKLEPFRFPGKNKIKVVYIGRFAYMKGVHNLLKSEIPKNIDLIFIGSNRGSNYELLNQLEEKTKNTDNVFYLGPLYGTHKIRAMQSADAIIVPSLHEPFGIVALEALAANSILISSFANGMGEFLDKNSAIYCSKSVDGVRESLDRLSNLSDIQKDTFKQNGQLVVKHYDWQDIAKKMENIYLEYK